MNIMEIFKDAFLYPIRSWNIFIVLGLLIYVSDSYGFLNYILLSFKAFSIEGLFLGLFSLVIFVIFWGYHLSIIKDTFDNSKYLPSFVLDRNFMDGIKVIFVQFVYSSPLIFIWIILAYFLGFFNLINLTSIFSNFGVAYLNYIFKVLFFDFVGICPFLLFLGIVFLFLFSFFFVIAESRLAMYGNLGSAFQIREILNDISKIGWKNYISWFIIFMMILSLLYLINGIIYFSGSIGVLISLVFIYNYILIFISRNIGLIYKMTKKVKNMK
jgi:uncharacterized protein DUF4013